jgi:hypothetical protein
MIAHILRDLLRLSSFWLPPGGDNLKTKKAMPMPSEKKKVL